MNYLVLIKPGQAPQLVRHEGAVHLETMYKLLEVDCVGYLSLGTFPTGGRRADIWFDDNGLLNAAIPNRRIGPETIICGSILACAAEGDQSVAMTFAEAGCVIDLAERSWERLPANYPKPEPHWEVIPLPPRKP